ncbi:MULTISPECIES: ApeP family dehydratase [unclassified Brenneria]|uniref:ApeP family dehydratase n=1 Tax=unclassified Brenneria TaxID=2634434 RepID=UPI0018F0CA9E|nr:hotdog family protein [Brenneria sp. L3-3C-1]MBJ7222258.1 hotdog family protein [Brenneria sp. L3-3C-1]MEE3643501.1 hotdog family protein [Brenneria sp. L3_3C_1]
MADYFPAAHYLPHQSPMVLVDEVIHVDDEHAHCRVSVSRAGILAPFLNADGHLPAWFGIEIIAQAIGVWSGWHGSRDARHKKSSGAILNVACDGPKGGGQDARHKKPRPGMLLGGRGYRCKQAFFPASSRLDVYVTLLMRDEKIGSFDGEIVIDGETYATGRLNTYQPDDNELKQLLEQGKQ